MRRREHLLLALRAAAAAALPAEELLGVVRDEHQGAARPLSAIEPRSKLATQRAARSLVEPVEGLVEHLDTWGCRLAPIGPQLGN